MSIHDDWLPTCECGRAHQMHRRPAQPGYWCDFCEDEFTAAERERVWRAMKAAGHFTPIHDQLADAAAERRADDLYHYQLDAERWDRHPDGVL